MSKNSKKRTEMIQKGTKYMRTLANRRATRTVSADDVHDFLSREGVRSKSPSVRISYVKSILRTPMFEVVGTVNSSRPQAKGRAISLWSIPARTNS